MTAPLRMVLVSGLSGAGKSSVLRALEDLGYEAIDNTPITMLEELASRCDRPLAVGVDARTRGFDADAVLDTLGRLRANPNLRPELLYAWADEAALLRRYTETRRRHPLAPQGRVTDGILAEEQLTAHLREAADLVIDTSDLPLSALRRLIARHFGADSETEGQAGMLVTLISFAFPFGLPREADLVFDCRFLRNPHYDPILRSRTGLEAEVGAYVAADPDFQPFYERVSELLTMLLPRFVQEGKKYVTVAVGCTGGRHRSVYLVERLAVALSGGGWRLHVTHRELAREGNEAPVLTDRSVPGRGKAVPPRSEPAADEGLDDHPDAARPTLQAREA
jgi:UPF0042 nucleotide-binding protein